MANKVKLMPSLSIRFKLLLSILGLVITILIGVLFAVSWYVERSILADIDRNFVEKGEVFERIQEVRFRQIREKAVLLADVPSLRRALLKGNGEAVNQVIRQELQPILDVAPVLSDTLITDSFLTNPDSASILLVSDRNALPVGQMSTTSLPRYSVAERGGVERALRGEYPQHSYIWEHENQFFNVTSVPIKNGNDIVGIVTYGFAIREREVEQISADLGMEVSIFINTSLVASSFKDLGFETKTAFSKEIYNTAYDILFTGEPTQFSFPLGEEMYQVYVTPMLPNVSDISYIPAFYVIARSYTKALAELNNIQWLIIYSGLVAIALSIVISTWLTKRFTRPIKLLVEGIKRIDKGDYSHPVPVVSKDEFALLTTRFNTLSDNLRERLEMLKFVSGATVEAIRKNVTDRELGGQRKEVTVFFSDIRGFTSWSEHKKPEEVISMLNSSLSRQADIVNKHGGDVDKFVGDELVAVFEGENMDRNAIATAIEIQKVMADLFASKKLSISVGIGINRGLVVMGAMGSDRRRDYTVIGNNVNLGARLCSAAKKGQILVSKAVANHLERNVVVQEIEPILAKGIEKPLPVYEVVWDGDGK